VTEQAPQWKSGTEVKESKRTLRDSVAHLREDNVGKDRRIAELEARLKAAALPQHAAGMIKPQAGGPASALLAMPRSPASWGMSINYRV
jgi:hypothetical protein